MGPHSHILDSRLLDRIWELLQDCGMPDRLPERDLLWDLYFMLSEHYSEEEES